MIAIKIEVNGKPLTESVPVRFIKGLKIYSLSVG